MWSGCRSGIRPALICRATLSASRWALAASPSGGQGSYNAGRIGFPSYWWAAGFSLVTSSPFGHQTVLRQTVLLQREAVRFQKSKSRPEAA